MLRRSLLAGVPAAALALALGCEAPAVTSLYELSGIISERFESGMDLVPVGGARVSFVSDTGRRFETTSGADGRYRMNIDSDTPFGQVRAEADGFQPSESTVYFDVPARRVDLDLRRE